MYQVYVYLVSGPVLCRSNVSNVIVSRIGRVLFNVGLHVPSMIVSRIGRVHFYVGLCIYISSMIESRIGRINFYVGLHVSRIGSSAM